MAYNTMSEKLDVNLAFDYEERHRVEEEARKAAEAAAEAERQAAEEAAEAERLEAERRAAQKEWESYDIRQGDFRPKDDKRRGNLVDDRIRGVKVDRHTYLQNRLTEAEYPDSEVSSYADYDIAKLADKLNSMQEGIAKLPTEGKIKSGNKESAEEYLATDIRALAQVDANEARLALQTKLSEMKISELAKQVAQARHENNGALAENATKILNQKIQERNETFKSQRDSEHNETRANNLKQQVEKLIAKEEARKAAEAAAEAERQAAESETLNDSQSDAVPDAQLSLDHDIASEPHAEPTAADPVTKPEASDDSQPDAVSKEQLSFDDLPFIPEEVEVLTGVVVDEPVAESGKAEPKSDDDQARFFETAEPAIDSDAEEEPDAPKLDNADAAQAEAESKTDPEQISYKIDSLDKRRRLVERFTADQHGELSVDLKDLWPLGKRVREVLLKTENGVLYVRENRLFNVTPGQEKSLAYEEKTGDFPIINLTNSWAVVPGTISIPPITEILVSKTEVLSSDSVLTEATPLDDEDPFKYPRVVAAQILKDKEKEKNSRRLKMRQDKPKPPTDDPSKPAAKPNWDTISQEAVDQSRRQRNVRNVWKTISGKVTNFSPREFYGNNEKGTKRALTTALGGLATVAATLGIVGPESFNGMKNSMRRPVLTQPDRKQTSTHTNHSSAASSGLNISMSRSSRKPYQTIHVRKSHRASYDNAAQTGSNHSTGTTVPGSHDGLNITMSRSSVTPGEHKRVATSMVEPNQIPEHILRELIKKSA